MGARTKLTIPRQRDENVRILHRHERSFFLSLKGLSHEIDFKNVEKKFTELGLNKGRGRFLNFPEAPLILNDK